jgi:hypothetical protein
MALPFTKVEGLGNDFLVVDLRPGRPAATTGGPSPEDPAVVRALCDRRFGVGGDGVLAILPSKTADAAHARPERDGSEAEDVRQTASAASPSCCTTPTPPCTAPPCASRPRRRTGA